MKKYSDNNRGFTLIELCVTIAIFSVVTVVALDIFFNVLKTNREVVQKQAIQDHTEFLLSLMTKEIRTAKINYGGDGVCGVKANDTYALANSGQELDFQNYEGVCVRYFKNYDNGTNFDRLMVDRYRTSDGPGSGVAVLPMDIEVKNINFEIQNKFGNWPDGLLQPSFVKVSLGLRSSVWDPSDIYLFEEISGRNIEQF